MSIALAWFLRGGWQYIAAAALVIGAYFWAYNRGADHTQAKWDAAKARGVLIIAAKNAELQTAKDRAESADAERDRAYQLVNRPIQNEVKAYVQTPGAAVRCIDPVGVSLGARAIAAANAATAAR